MSVSFKKHIKLNTNIGIIFSLILLIYLVSRAFLVPFLHDEIMTYWFYINTGNFIPFSYKIDINAANNHVLNTLLSRFFYLLFGYTPIVLRMANLIFVPLYCFFAYKISNLLNNKYLATLFFLCVLFIHSIVEFMALSRGYGMSFALLLGCLWYLIDTINYRRISSCFLTLLFLVAAVSANLTLVTTSLIVIVVLFVNILFLKEIIVNKLFKTCILVIMGVIPICFFVLYSFALQKGGALYYGNHDGFWLRSVSTLMKALFNTESNFLRIALFLYFILVLVMFIKYIYLNLSIKIIQHSVLIFPMLLIGNIMAVLILNRFFNVNLPEDRSGFYFYYFFIGSVFFLLDKFAETIKLTRIAWITLPLLCIPLHFAYASNLTYIAVYKEDRVPYRFYNEINEKSKSMHEVATLGSYFGRTLVLAYQNYLNNGNVSKCHDSDYPSLIPDFQVVKTEEFAIWSLYYNAIDFDKVSGYHLLERKNKLKRHKIIEFPAISSKGIIKDEFFNLAEGRIDTLIQKPLFFEYNMDIESKSTPFEAWIVLAVSDSIEKTTAYEYIPLNWIKNEWNATSKHFHSGQLLTNLPATSLKYITYIWNIDKQAFSITNAKVIIKELEE